MSLIPLSSLTLACRTSDPLSEMPDGFEYDLTDQGGCSDLVVYARKPDDSIALYFTRL